MGIVQRKPTQPETTNVLPTVTPQNQRTNIVDNRKTQTSSLLQYMSGSHWKVNNYYGQILGSGNDVKDLDINQTGVYQQYYQVRDLRLNVVEPLTSSTDTENGLTIVIGASTVHHSITPNKGDMLEAMVAGRVALFKIIEPPIRKSLNNDSAFEIRYVMMEYIENIQSTLENLISKVTRKYVYEPERLSYSKTALLLESEHELYNKFDEMYNDLTSYYLKTFFNRQCGTFVLPKQKHIIYDNHLVNFIRETFDHQYSEIMSNIRYISDNNTPYLETNTIYELLVKPDIIGLNSLTYNFGFVSKTVFDKTIIYSNGRYQHYDYILYPELNEEINSSGQTEKQCLESILTLEPTPNGITNLRNLFKEEIRDEKLKSYTKQVSFKPYIFSLDFYNQTGSMNHLEIMVTHYINNKELDNNILYELLKRFKNWSLLDQFYYGPILLLLIKYTMRS